MKVQTAAGTTIELGTTETTPTVGITDYSRRLTNDFGVTNVVERGFSRRMSVRFALPAGEVDAVQQKLVELRASPARWTADGRFKWLDFQGFYKDFDLELATPTLSYCRLTVESLALEGGLADSGGDPAMLGQASTLRLLQPSPITDASLAASSLPENEYPTWAAGTVYTFRTRVIKAHRVYESASDNNLGNDPATSFDKWFDVGPTNKWAMFDQALGSTTSALSSISVTLAAGTVNAVALLDVKASSVRVQAAGYDRTQLVSGSSVTFLDLPTSSGQVTVNITGTGQVSVGTLLIGKVVSLGVTEAAPTAGITDFSRKETDDFGEVSVVERAWSKRMTARALIRTEALDTVANRIATVRARPSLWIGQSGLDSLTIYGFFRDFLIEVGETVSKLSLSIEGLSKAPPSFKPSAETTDRGRFNFAETYRVGDVVSLANGSTWEYINATPSTGNPPPSAGTSNTWWEQRTPPAGASSEQMALIESIQDLVDGRVNIYFSLTPPDLSSTNFPVTGQWNDAEFWSDDAAWKDS